MRVKPRKWICITLLAAAWIVSPEMSADEVDWVSKSPVPIWIWDAGGSSDNQQIFLQKKFLIDGEVDTARLYTTCDNSMTLWINGEEVGSSEDWPDPIQQEVAQYLLSGTNTIAVHARNAGSAAAFVFKLDIKLTTGRPIHVVSDKTWKMTKSRPHPRWFTRHATSKGWTGSLQEIGELGIDPWAVPGAAPPKATVNAHDLTVPQDFAVDLVYTVPADQQGSWVCLTTLPDCGLLACDQEDKGLFRIDIAELNDGPQATVTKLQFDQQLSGARPAVGL